MELRTYSFTGHKIGDKVNACYQLSYYKEKGLDFILIDPSYKDANSFPVKRFFPNISNFILEVPPESKQSDQIFLELSSKFPSMGFGNLWISAPSLKQDTGYLPSMSIPSYVKDFQSSLKFEVGKSFKKSDYKHIIVNHCLVDAPYNVRRNHDYSQWNMFFNLVRNYIEDNNLPCLVIDIPINYMLPVWQIIAIIDLGDIFVGGDTGFTHIAAALHKNIIAIYCDDMIEGGDVKSFEPEKIRMGASHSWSSDPISNMYKKFLLDDNHKFNQEEVFEHLKTLLI